MTGNPVCGVCAEAEEETAEYQAWLPSLLGVFVFCGLCTEAEKTIEHQAYSTVAKPGGSTLIEHYHGYQV
jgi:hypothetical protein